MFFLHLFLSQKMRTLEMDTLVHSLQVQLIVLNQKFLYPIKFIVIAIVKKDDFTFQQLTTSCEEFDLLGSVAYNKDKTAIHISDVEYCEDEIITYDEISCVLYEENQGNKIKIRDKYE